MKNSLPKLNAFEKVLAILFKRYTYKIYRKGVRDGFNWKR